MWEHTEPEAAGSSASNQICLKTKSLPTNISSGACCQLSAFHTCQSYLQTSISPPSFTGQLPIFVSADVSSAARQRPTDVEPFALHAHVYLLFHPPPPTPPPAGPPYPLLLLRKTGCSPNSLFTGQYMYLHQSVIFT